MDAKMSIEYYEEEAERQEQAENRDKQKKIQTKILKKEIRNNGRATNKRFGTKGFKKSRR